MPSRSRPQMPAAVQKATTKFLGNRAALVDALGNDVWQALRQAGHDLRLHAITPSRPLSGAGGATGHRRRAARCTGRGTRRRPGASSWTSPRQHRVKLAVKSKSMATEEIGLNHAMEAAGIRVLETDLGEYIVQLKGMGPAHIVVPAFHLSKEEIAALFREKLGVDAPAEAEKLTQIARMKLREEFLAADLGISGGNFLVAETGTIVTVTNEGNGRMCYDGASRPRGGGRHRQGGSRLGEPHRPPEVAGAERHRAEALLLHPVHQRATAHGRGDRTEGVPPRPSGQRTLAHPADTRDSRDAALHPVRGVPEHLSRVQHRRRVRLRLSRSPAPRGPSSRARSWVPRPPGRCRSPRRCAAPAMTSAR